MHSVESLAPFAKGPSPKALLSGVPFDVTVWVWLPVFVQVMRSPLRTETVCGLKPHDCGSGLGSTILKLTSAAQTDSAWLKLANVAIIPRSMRAGRARSLHPLTRAAA